MRLAEQMVLVTGGGSGLGRANLNWAEERLAQAEAATSVLVDAGGSIIFLPFSTPVSIPVAAGYSTLQANTLPSD